MWKDNIKIVKKISCRGVDWNYMAEKRGPGRAVSNTVTNIRVT
jgi:hypothetical protein